MTSLATLGLTLLIVILVIFLATIALAPFALLAGFIYGERKRRKLERKP